MKGRSVLLVGAALIVSCGQGEEGGDLYRQVAPAYAHTCANTDQGRIVCWGNNASFQLGAATVSADDPNPRYLLTGPLFVEEVSTGATFGCGRLRGSGAVCWGADAKAPQVVAEETNFRRVSVGIFACGVARDGSASCWASPKSAVVAVPGLTGASEIAVGGDRACAAGSGIGIVCWTSVGGATSVLGGTTGTSYHSLTLGDNYGCGIGVDSIARCWGTNTYGQLGDGTFGPKAVPVPVLQGDRPTTTDRFVSVHGGHNLTCGVTISHGGYCWGQNYPYPVTTPKVTEWNDLRPGGFHACGFARDDDALYCWGENGSGQIGNGKRTFADLPTKVNAP